MHLTCVQFRANLKVCGANKGCALNSQAWHAHNQQTALALKCLGHCMSTRSAAYPPSHEHAAVVQQRSDQPRACHARKFTRPAHNEWFPEPHVVLPDACVQGCQHMHCICPCLCAMVLSYCPLLTVASCTYCTERHNTRRCCLHTIFNRRYFLHMPHVLSVLHYAGIIPEERTRLHMDMSKCTI